MIGSRHLNVTFWGATMNDLRLNQTFQATGAPFTEGEVLRIVWITNQGIVAMIPLMQSYSQRKPPTFIQRTTVEQWILGGQLNAVEVRPTPYALLDDKALMKSLLNQRGKPKGQGLYPLEFRKKWQAILLPISAHASEYWEGASSLRSLIARYGPDSHAASIQSIYLELYRFWANGSDPLAILPTTRKCGGKGNQRSGAGVSLGRRRVTANPDLQTAANYPLTAEEISNIRYAWSNFVTPDRSVHAAYRKYLNTYHVEYIERVGGRLIIRHHEQVPTISQFRYHGRKQSQELSAFRLRLIGNDHSLNYRALDGKADVRTFETGLVGVLDASSNDTNLCSIYDPLHELGPARILPVVEITTGYIAGFSQCWNVNEEAANLAILHAGSSKVQYCSRYGLQITEEDWFAMQFAEVIGDHGELHNIASRERTKATKTQLSILPVGRGDLKGSGEYVHAVLHNHDLPGSTGGKIRDRGDPRRNEVALLNSYDYACLVIREILRHNNEEIVPHLLNTEMKQDNVKPTRKEIINWSMAKGYHHFQYVHKDALITSRCPQTEAVVKRDGIYLMALRNGTTGDQLILPDHRYLSEWCNEKGWLETSRRSGSWHINVYYNPNDLSEIYYLDLDDGLQCLKLATTDPLLAERVTWMDAVSDVITSPDRLRLVRHDQTEGAAASDLDREIDIQNAKERRREIEEYRGKPAASTAKKRRANRTNEVSHGGNVPVHFPDTGSQTPDSESFPQLSPDSTKSGSQRSSSDSAVDEIERFLRKGEGMQT